MKTLSKSILTSIIIILVFNAGMTQFVSGFNYQAVVRNSNGTIMKNTPVSLRATISNDDGNIFEKTYNISTNEFGLLNVVIGKESTDFNNIDWSNGKCYLHIEIDTGNGFTDMGTSTIYPVPMANLAKDVINNDDADADPDNELQTLSISGDQLTISSGNTITLPTNPGDQWGSQVVQSDNSLLGDGTNTNPLSVNTGSNAFDGWDKNASDDFSGNFGDLSNIPSGLSDGDDDTHLTEAQVDNYVSNNGYLTSEVDGNITNELQTLSISGNQLTISLGNTVTLPSGGATKLNDLSDAKYIDKAMFIGQNAGQNFTTNGKNIVGVGHEVLKSNTSGDFLTAVGPYCLYSNQTGQKNTALGFSALNKNIAGSGATAIGYYAMYYANNTAIPFENYNVAVGNNALRGSTIPANNTGNFNTAVGSEVLMIDSYGHSNSAYGYRSMYSNINGSYNSAFGYESLYKNNYSGDSNSAFGYESLHDNSGSFNSAFGHSSLHNNTNGSSNSAFGKGAMYNNTTGNKNTSLGYGSFSSNIAGNGATAIGYHAMYYANNATSAFDNNNVAVGYQALRGSTTASDNTGNYNTVVGREALMNNTKGGKNSAFGYKALFNNIHDNNPINGGIGSNNSAFGYETLANNTIGKDNCAFGIQALINNTKGDRNCAFGDYALYLNNFETSFPFGDYGNENCAFGYNSLYNNKSGDNNTAIGYDAFSEGSSYNNSAGIGYDAEPGGSNRIMIGNSSVTWIGGHSTWHNTSDARIKNNIKEDVKGLDFIMKLRPVTYNIDKDKLDALIGTVDSSDYAEKYDVEKIKQSGFIAQEVERAAQEAGYDFSGVSKPKGDVKYYSLAYSEFVVPVVKAVQEQEQQIQRQRTTIQEQLEKIEKLNNQIQNLRLNLDNQKHVNQNQEKKIQKLEKEILIQQKEFEILKVQNTEILKRLEALEKK